jgi:hypothetical protein
VGVIVGVAFFVGVGLGTTVLVVVEVAGGSGVLLESVKNIYNRMPSKFDN